MRCVWVVNRMAVACGAVLALLSAAVDAQVQCTMPNGVVIEQKLSNVCPAGARAGQLADGSSAPIQGQVAPAPITTDRWFVKRQVVTRKEFAANWPLKLDVVTLRCKWPDSQRLQLHALLVEVGGDLYALNGTASAHAKANGWRDVKEIWRDDPRNPGLKVPLTPLIERAQALCR